MNTPPTDQQAENVTPTPIEGTYPTPEESFYISWAEEVLRGSAKAVNDSVQRSLTLTTALLGGSVVLLRPEVIDPGFRMAALSSLVVALGACVWASYPRENDVCLTSPDHIKSVLEEGLKWKMKVLSGANGLLFLGLTIATLGVLLKQH